MGKIFTLWVMCAVWVVATTSAASYNETNLWLYTRLSQQMRYQLADLLQQAAVRQTTMSTTLGIASQYINDMLVEMRDSINPVAEQVSNLGKRGGQPLVNSILLTVSDPFQHDLSNILFNTVDWSYGIQYDTGTGDAFIERSGIYLLDFSVHEEPITYMKVRIKVHRPDLTLRYDFFRHLAYGESPCFETLRLYAGDRFDTLTLGQSGNFLWTYGGIPITTTPGMSTQMSLRYLGPIPSS